MRRHLVTPAVWIIAALLASCGIAPNKPSAAVPKPRLYLPEEVLAANGDSAVSLYKAWITPARINGELRFYEAELAANEAAVREGVRRFCEHLGAVFTTESQRFGDQHRCDDRQGTFIAQFNVLRYEGNILGIRLETPERRRKEAAEIQAFETQLAQNGPTGWVDTDAGKFRFLRVGTLSKRHMVVLNDHEKTVSIDNFSRIDFSQTGEVEATLQDGSQYKRKSVRLFKKLAPDGSAYFYGNGVPFVVIDPDSGQPYTRRFMPFVSLKSIVIDPPESGWKNQPATVIETTFDLFGDEAISRYTQSLRQRAQRRLAEAQRNGRLQRLPDGKLAPELVTPVLMKSLTNALDSLTRKWDCKGDLAGDQYDGIESLEVARQCKVAERELRIVAPGLENNFRGGSLSPTVTPLSMLIVINLMQGP